MRLQSFLKVARGEKEADLLLKNCRVVNLFNHSIENTSLAVHDGLIVGTGDYAARNMMDLKGSYVAPGLIEGHIHIESSMVSPAEFSRAVLPHGTTAVVADPHEIANVMGGEGIKYMLDAGSNSPLDVFIMLPSCVPATDLETSGARLGARELKKLLGQKMVTGLGEMMNYPGVVFGNPDVLAKIKMAGDYIVDGHAPGLSGNQLNAYIGAGVKSDHECTTLEEAREKLAKGMYIMIRLGSTAKNMDKLLPLVNEWTCRFCMLVTDDLPPNELLARGHLDYLLRKAVKKGIDPITAISMVTWTPAQYFRLNGYGAIAPGYQADLVVFKDLVDFQVERVLKQGQIAAEAGKSLSATQMVLFPGGPLPVNIKAEDLHLKPSGGLAKVIGVIPDQIVTEKRILAVKIDNGEVVTDISRDILKIAVVERHRATGNIGLGLVQGFELKSGAIASSVAHDSHNLIAVGTNDADIVTAVNRVAAIGGGQVVVSKGEIKAELPLPVAGLMSELPVEEVATRITALNRETALLGCTLKAPFMTLGFMALPVIPELKITDKGLVDVNKFDMVSLFGK